MTDKFQTQVIKLIFGMYLCLLATPYQISEVTCHLTDVKLISCQIMIEF